MNKYKQLLEELVKTIEENREQAIERAKVNIAKDDQKAANFNAGERTALSIVLSDIKLLKRELKIK